MEKLICPYSVFNVIEMMSDQRSIDSHFFVKKKVVYKFDLMTFLEDDGANSLDQQWKKDTEWVIIEEVRMTFRKW